MFNHSGMHPFDSEEELQQYFQRHKNNRDFAVIFTQDGSNGQLNYTIRTRNNNFRTEQIYLDNIYEIANRGEWFNHRFCHFLFAKKSMFTWISDIDEYIDSGFLALQRSIDKEYIELTSDQSRTEFKVGQLCFSAPLIEWIPFKIFFSHCFSLQLEFQKFPLNARERKQFIGIKQTGIFVVIIYSFTALLNMILVPMVEEKGCGVKEFLRIASAQSYLNNVTFFFTNLFIGCIIFGLTLIIAACYQLLAHVVGLWLIVLLFLYLTSAIAFTFLLTVAFDSGEWSTFNGGEAHLTDFVWITCHFSLINSLLCKNWRLSLLHRAIPDRFVQRENVRPNFTGFQFGRAVEGLEFTGHLWHER